MTYTTKTASGFVLKSEWYQHPFRNSNGRLRSIPLDHDGRPQWSNSASGKWKGFKSWRAWADAQIEEASQYAIEGV